MSYAPNPYFEDAVIDSFGNVLPLGMSMPQTAPVLKPRYPKAEPRPKVKPVPEHYRIRNEVKQAPVQKSALRVPPPPPIPAEWKDPDVHFWSPAMRELVKTEYPRLRDQTRVYMDRFDESVAEIRAYYGNDPMIARVMDKMVARKRAIDVDLLGVMPAGLLALVWAEYVLPINEKECYDLFKGTLLDMGERCIAGDTHRLFSILVALHRAEE
jgi:hypothetical protein